MELGISGVCFSLWVLWSRIYSSDSVKKKRRGGDWCSQRLVKNCYSNLGQTEKSEVWKRTERDELDIQVFCFFF